MAIVYTFDRDGGFIAGDTKTKVTSYAYPSSANASHAKRAPDRVAAEMMKSENAYGRHGFTHEIDGDHRNWTKLDMATA